MIESRIPIDCMIIGGGATGMFTLDACVASGYSTLLLESNALGAGHTIQSQGMIMSINRPHTTKGNRDEAATPSLQLTWRRYLAGEITPNLHNVALRSEYCHVWRTATLGSTLRWFGIPLSTRGLLQPLSAEERPAILKGCNGLVTRLDGQVVEPRSLLESLGHTHTPHLLLTTDGGVEVLQQGSAWLIRLLNPETGEPLDFIPKKIVLTSGAGNAALRSMFNLPTRKRSEKTFRIVLIRGDLPVVNGYCFDGMRSPTVITTTTDYANRRVWQVCSRYAKQRSTISTRQLIHQTLRVLHTMLPDFDSSTLDYTTYETTYLEHHPQIVYRGRNFISEEGDILTCKPIDLAFAPRVASEIIGRIKPSLSRSNKSLERNARATYGSQNEAPRSIQDVLKAVTSWPRPAVAFPPWESDQQWMTVAQLDSC